MENVRLTNEIGKEEKQIIEGNQWEITRLEQYVQGNDV